MNRNSATFAGLWVIELLHESNVPRKSLAHIHRTIHLSGSQSELNTIAQSVLGVSLDQIQSTLKP